MYTSVVLLKQLYPMVNSMTTVQSGEVAAFINQADSIINAKIARTYTVPIVPTPPLLETLSSDLAMYALLAKRFFTQKQMNESVWPSRFKEAMTLLDELSEGKATLVSSDGTIIDTAESSDAFQSSTLNYNPTFTEDVEENSFIDSDKIDDLRAVR